MKMYSPERKQPGLARYSDEELTAIVRSVLDEMGIPYKNVPGGFHWPGLHLDDFCDEYMFIMESKAPTKLKYSSKSVQLVADHNVEIKSLESYHYYIGNCIPAA